jgi:hypothetical protein
MPIESPIDVTFLYEIKNYLQAIIEGIKGLSASDWIQFAVVIVAVMVPFCTLRHEKREKEKENTNKEKQLLIALHSCLVGNFRIISAFRNDYIQKKEAAHYIIRKVRESNEQNTQTLLKEIVHNDLVIASGVLDSNHFHPLLNLSYIICKLNFITEKIPQTFFLLNDMMGFQNMFETIQNERNNLIASKGPYTVPWIDEDVLFHFDKIAALSRNLCLQEEQYLYCLCEVIKRIELYLKKYYHYNVSDHDIEYRTLPDFEKFTMLNDTYLES